MAWRLPISSSICLMCFTEDVTGDRLFLNYHLAVIAWSNLKYPPRLCTLHSPKHPATFLQQVAINFRPHLGAERRQQISARCSGIPLKQSYRNQRKPTVLRRGMGSEECYTPSKPFSYNRSYKHQLGCGLPLQEWRSLLGITGIQST